MISLFKNRKFWALFFLAGALIIMLLLASGIAGLKFLPGQSFEPAKIPQAGQSGALGGGDILVIILRAFLAVAIVSLPVYIIMSLLTPEGRKRLLGDIVAILLLMFSVWVIGKLMQSSVEQRIPPLQIQPQLTALPPCETEVGGGTSTPEIVCATPVPGPIKPPDWFILVLSLLIGLSLVGLILGIFWLIRWNNRRRAAPLDQLAQKAQAAVDSLQSGGNLKEVIIRCYRDMIRVVSEERGILRDSAMTPKEFEQVLESRGLPPEPVHQLTRLFEEVRYGSIPLGQQEEKRAFTCLTTIIDACKSVQ